MYVPERIEKILFTSEQIDERVKGLGAELTRELKSRGEKELPLFLCALRGAVVFFTDLIRAVEVPIEIGFIRAKSYAGSSSTGNVTVDMLTVGNIEGRGIVLVEDICDSGRSLQAIKEELLGRGARSVDCVCLLDKPSRRVADTSPDHTGFVIDDLFVVGYGLDYNEFGRNLPYIGIYKQN